VSGDESSGGLLTRLLDRNPPYVLVRFVLLRWLALVYLVAFSVAAIQAVPLIGAAGLLPVPSFLDAVRAASGGARDAFLELPTLFWFGYSDAALRGVAWLGVALSALALLGATNAALQFVLWVLYLSIVQVGQRFYGYGWETQLLETGLLAVFLAPLCSVAPNARGVPFLAVLLMRWLVFRVFLGAGLIKIRGDACWRDFTCLFTHYETQPIPNPLSPWFHHAPAWFHRAGVAVNHLVELVAPWFAFGPRRVRLLAGTAFVLFQATLILSGNLSFLNWLTIVPAIACFDDAALRAVCPARWRERLPGVVAACSTQQLACAAIYAGLVAVLSVNPVLNLMSPGQAMNRSFDRLHLVNTYGAFGSVGKQRDEVIVSGTSALQLGPDAVFEEYEFPCKPGDVNRRPCWISPYHLRLDWQLWFAALGDPGREPWIVHLVDKLLAGDPAIAPLLARNPFAGTRPRFVRVELYRYRMTRPWDSGRAWWTRTHLGSYIPPVSRDDPRLRAFLRRHGWARR
jgi:hypothetical protein